MSRRRRSDQGQGLVEFALVIPMMLLFVFGLVDLGRGIYTYSVLSNVAREGARYAIVHGSLATETGNTQSGPGTSDPSGGTYVVPAATVAAFGLDPTVLKVAVCWGFQCTVAPDCTPGSSTEKPLVDTPVTVRACYRFQAVTASFLGIMSIPLAAAATLSVTH